MDHPIFSILSRHRFGRDTLVVAKADDGNFWLVHDTTNERVPLINFGCGDNGRVAALRAMWAQLKPGQDCYAVGAAGCNVMDYDHLPAVWVTFEAARAFAAAYVRTSSWRVTSTANGYAIERLPGQGGSMVTWSYVDRVFAENAKLAALEADTEEET